MRHRHYPWISRAGLLALLAWPCACTATGELELVAYGEPFIEQQIPATAMADGWTIEFERFVVHFANVELDGVAILEDATIDLAQDTAGAGHTLQQSALPVDTYGSASFSMLDLDVAGTARRGQQTVAFAWYLPVQADYVDCEVDHEVTQDDPARFELTVHADHLFYDSLVSESPNLRFDAIAEADVDLDGMVTLEELATRPIAGYDPGNASVPELRTWLMAQARTLGHVDGEGHCRLVPEADADAAAN